jgi:hypothetical protein
MKYSNLDAVPAADLPWLQEVKDLDGRRALCERCWLHLIDEPRIGGSVDPGPWRPRNWIAIGEQCVSCGLIRSGILERLLDTVEQAVTEARMLGATEDDIAFACETRYPLSDDRWKSSRQLADYPAALRVIVAEARSLAEHDRWAHERDATPAEEHG